MYEFGFGTHPETKKPLIVVGAPRLPIIDVVGMLRLIKQHYPKEFRQVQYELVNPVNGKSFEVPEEIGDKPKIVTEE